MPTGGRNLIWGIQWLCCGFILHLPPSSCTSVHAIAARLEVMEGGNHEKIHLSLFAVGSFFFKYYILENMHRQFGFMKLLLRNQYDIGDVKC